MTDVTRREQLRAATEQDIRTQARGLLVREGQEAVTLRAIARELGITAPALYRYYDSREDLLSKLGDDICADLSAELDEALRTVADDHVTKVFAVCRRFRQWALAHPREFTLVFATPRAEYPGTASSGNDEFGRVFLGVVGPLMAEGAARTVPAQMPEEALADLADSRRSLEAAFDREGIEMPPEALRPDAVYFLLRWWARLYGQVALEVFGRFPFDVKQADRLFESMLTELARDAGLH